MGRWAMSLERYSHVIMYQRYVVLRARAVRPSFINTKVYRQIYL